ncbi:RAMP superfamily CRISPR-associated protein [Frankia tisae]|uniref:RAMP superfamily CRISPR-associated protein n=1 Tax=Frankia tisae TaxID=2950104 RepID=UPI0021BE3162|nr:RAMP superfamily CRISPR-associated protein [Frankia tisae]
MNYTGKIIVRVVDGQTRIEVEPDIGKKRPVVPPSELSPALAAKLADGTLAGTKVVYEYESRKACKVRGSGEPEQRSQTRSQPQSRPRPLAGDRHGAGSSGGSSSGSGRSGVGPDPGPTAFHNPYTFVPALDRDPDDHDLGDGAWRATDTGEQTRPTGGLGDHGHDRLRPGRITGTIAVRLRTVTPLVLLDTARFDEDANTQHKTFPVLERQIDGVLRPHLPATAVKGMLRSAYEAVTNSRMGVFAEHHEKLTYRLPGNQGRRGRAKYPVAPEELLARSLRPARSLAELSPADRVFGWVRDVEAGRGRGTGAAATSLAAARGCLRIGPVTCTATSGSGPGKQDAAPDDGGPAVQRFDGDGLPLAILGEPKPEQGRFYVGYRRSDGVALPLTDQRVRRPAWYESADRRVLRGRKVYPHHAGLPAGYWDKPTDDRTQTLAGDRYQEYRRPLAAVSDDDQQVLSQDGKAFRTKAPGTPGAEKRDSQNRSICGWVRPGTEFTFTVDVRNLTEVELGTLLWLLHDLGERGGHHRLGFGKPLGFGSVTLSIAWSGTELADGDTWAEHYLGLSPAASPDGHLSPDDRERSVRSLAERAVDTYQGAVARVGVPGQPGDGDRTFDAAPHIRAFLATAIGDPDAPVHYPRRPHRAWLGDDRIPPDPRGRSYEWFVENERPNKVTQALPEPGRGTLSTRHSETNGDNGGQNQWGNQGRQGNRGRQGGPGSQPRRGRGG